MRISLVVVLSLGPIVYGQDRDPPSGSTAGNYRIGGVGD